jgi:hypothetical protein
MELNETDEILNYAEVNNVLGGNITPVIEKKKLNL